MTPGEGGINGFDRLHPRLQHALVNDLGWRDLRPVQDLAIEAVLDGCNTVILAPTAGGKTEAALFPVLSRILVETLQPIACLYVCPIRALLNNQEARVARYARMVGLDAFKWHGDVAATRKQAFRREPAHILMTTPESLEVLLIGHGEEARALFAGLSAVIVDEVHAFAGDDRGAHLAAILERLSRFCGRDLQRIGLSATVGNPEEIGRWLQGSSARPFRLVDPPRPPAGQDLRIDFAADVDLAARSIAQEARGLKSLVFVESRSQAERVAHAMAGRGVQVFIHHSSISRADRQQAEEQFAGGQNVAIVCTSTMELGIDIGDLDRVVQVEVPDTVASFVQRMGRTGRRPGTRANCTFHCTSPEALLHAAAAVRLAVRGWVEDVRPVRRAVHVLAHQILALSLQEGGISRHRVLPWVRQAFPFSELTDADVAAVADTMVARDILYEADGRVSLGKAGEEMYGWRNFFELYAVFSAPPVFRVLHGRAEVGFVSAMFVQGHDPADGPLRFRLAGRPWEVTATDWGRATLHVRAAERGRVPSWYGPPRSWSYDVCQEMRRTLMEPGVEEACLSAAAAQELAALREGYQPLLESSAAPLEDLGDQVVWHTFAGAGTNRLLSAGLSRLTATRWTAGNLSIKARGLSAIAARQAIERLPEVDWPALAVDVARNLVRGRLSKFQPCMPPHAEERLLVERLLDVRGVMECVGN